MSIVSAVSMVSIASIALGMALGSVGVDPPASKRMADGKEWTTTNLNVDSVPSSCYDDADANCRRYGRLYTWEAAQRGCRALGERWRLPTEQEWHDLGTRYGGLMEEAKDGGHATFAALLIGGSSGFDAMLGGNRNGDDGSYARLEAHGFYWTATETTPGHAWFYNFGRGGGALNRHRDIDTRTAASVRCIRD